MRLKKKVQVTHFFLLNKKKTYNHILIWRPFFVKGLSLLKALGHGLNGLGLWPALKGRWILYLDDGLDSMTDDLEWGLA